MNPYDSGLYLLVMSLSQPVALKAGKLPLTQLEPGTYLYVGRARKNLKARVARHLRQEKKAFWHIDYLLQNTHVTSVGIRHNFFDECSTIHSLHRQIPESRNPLPGFGASDCRCDGHLLYLPPGKQSLARHKTQFFFAEVRP